MRDIPFFLSTLEVPATRVSEWKIFVEMNSTKSHIGV